MTLKKVSAIIIIAIFTASVLADSVRDRQITTMEYHFVNQKYPLLEEPVDPNNDSPRGNIVWAYSCLGLAKFNHPDVNQSDIQLANDLIIQVYNTWPVPTEENGVYWMLRHLSRMLLEQELAVNLYSQTREAVKEILYNYVWDKDFVSDANTSPETVWHSSNSDNHNITRKQTFLTTAQIFKDDPNWSSAVYADGKSPQEHYQSWCDFFLEYFKQRAMKGVQMEVGSPSYSGLYLGPVVIIRDLVEHQPLQVQADKYLDLYFADAGIETLKGVRGGAKIRAYKDQNSYLHKMDKLAYFTWLFSGLPDSGVFTRGNSPFDLLPGCTSDYRLPDYIIGFYQNYHSRGRYEYVTSRPGRGYYTSIEPLWTQFLFPSYVKRYSYVSEHFVSGHFTLDENIDYANGFDQNHWMGVITADNYDGRIYFTCEGADFDSRKGYEDLQAIGSKGTIICRRNKNIRQDDRALKVYISNNFSYQQTTSGWVFGQNSDSTVYFGLFSTDGDLWNVRYEFASAAPAPGDWVTFTNLDTFAILEVGLGENYNSFEDFKSDVISNYIEGSGASGQLQYTGNSGDEFVFYSDKRVPLINGSQVNLNPSKTYDSPYINADFNSPLVKITGIDGSENILNFNYCTEILKTDLNQDCYVDIRDFAIFSSQWLDCTEPDDTSCF